MRNQRTVKDLGNYKKLYIYPNGIATVADGSTGLGHSVHPNIDRSGSVTGMKQRGYWSKSDKVVTAGGFKYNISRLAYNKSDPLDMIAYENCMCEECAKRKKKKEKEEQE